ncbi:MAG: hypothetical protein IPN17_29680 [Deltaproteobacteria bacterium]|nr:hypothetical protein [Deltaproteobacteria bacterium]
MAARAAWVAAPDARVNPLLMRAGAQLVSFYPCRFDCPRAVAMAEGLRAVLAARDPGAARALMATLSRAVVIASDGARAQAVVVEEWSRGLGAHAGGGGRPAGCVARGRAGGCGRGGGRRGARVDPVRGGARVVRALRRSRLTGVRRVL